MTEQRSVFQRHRPRFTARARLALSYALLITVCGAVLLTVVAVYIGYFPDYAFDTSGNEGTSDQLFIALDDPEIIRNNFTVEVETREDMIALLFQVSGVALVMLAALSSAVAWLLAGRMLKPIAEVNEAAKLAATGRLDHRIGYTGPRDEIADLADTFDDMLDSIGRSVAAQRRFTANASHELRTPLAVTRTMLDVALATPGNIDREVLRRLREVNERSARTLEALLDLAQLEAGKMKTVPVDLATAVAKMLRQNQPDIHQRGLRLKSGLDSVVAWGDELLINQLVQNLIQNAIQHNVDHGSIVVCTEMLTGDHGTPLARLTVENTGEVVDPATLEQLTEPFRTVSGRTAGARRGLGLSIVSAIVERSGGDLHIAANPNGGLKVTVTLPVPQSHPTNSCAGRG